eukprot:CAMPEP_0201922538 /NCGR_PEP_ID=MMETSP0903-20130614/10548_1 /ASSEMBLY_ACC=CAM_ASM_000552 /TAXON_ID=420261 /ORGANISM="Thalassiosira antarctica, Strain CCMP982" /LENGTH=1589 /DNA_ID=CAMNT_0048459697 /DNA_START=141 /DNA_END=4910 /DNA_ORIENTATION=+
MSTQGIVIVDDSTRPPPTTATASASTTNKTNGKILQKRWVCDVCKVKWFLDFKEACAHEAECTGGSSPSSSVASSSEASSSESEAEAANVVSENSMISADPNDGNDAKTAHSSVARERRGVTDKPPSDKVAVVIAASSARESKEKNANKVNDASISAVQHQRGHGASKSRVAEIVDLSDPEDGKSDSSPASSGSGGKRKSDIIFDESASLEQPSESGSGRRKSKRLRDAPSKPPPLKDSITSDNTSNKANGKKAKMSKTSKSSDKSSSKSEKPPKKKGTEKANSGGQLASIFLSKKAPKTATAAPKKELKKGTAKVVIPGVSKEEYEEHVAAEKQAAQRKKRAAEADDKKAKKKQTITGVSKEEYEEHVAAEKQAAKRKKRAAEADDKKPKKKQTLNKRSKRSAKKDEQEVLDIESSCDDDSDDEEFVTDKPTSKNSRKTDSSTTATTTKKKNFLSKKLLAEHQAADFFAKRKKAAAEERERQKKREELRLARLNGKNGGKDVEIVDVKAGKSSSVVSLLSGQSSEKSSDMSFDLSAEGKKVKCIPAVRFPCPSHVVPADDDSESPLQMETDTSPSLQVLRKTPRYQHLKVDMSPSSSNASETSTYSTSFIQDTDHMASLEKNTTFDLLSSVFNQQGKGNKKKKNPSSDDVDNNQLWVDKYSMSHIPNDVLGTNNKEASQKLLDFIEEWKVRRHKSVQSMGQAKRGKKKRSRKKRCAANGYDSSDSFMDDGGLENIFLVTGPTGSGKTRLVHAVAEQLECVVIELNSSEQRSGAALKRAIQETTQSHSSLAISKKKRYGKKKKVANNNFSGNNTADEAADDDEADAEDGGGDEDSDDSCCFDSESDEESIRESHSLTVILIDEVDLLFDEDTAFWPALAQVSQKAKCPIVLTATSVPKELRNFKFQNISLDRPPPQECGIKMAQVSQSEGMLFQEDVVLEEKLKRLSLVAEVCQCDIRKIMNKMQLFHFAESRRSCRSSGSNARIDMDNFGLLPNNPSPSNGVVLVEDRPSILSVEPKLVPRDGHTLITITGTNFSQTAFPSQQCKVVEPTNLFIGGEQCRHFRVVSDDTIVAVCPPCVLPKGVSEGAICEDELTKNIDCLTCKFVEVVVRKKCSNGLVLDSSSCIGLEKKDGTKPITRCWSVEYDIPLRDSVWEQKKLSRDEFIRKSKFQQRRAREKMAENEDDGFLSSSEEEFEKKPAAMPALQGEEDQGQHERDDVEKMEDLPQEKEPEVKDIDPQVMLDEAISGMILCEKGPSNKAVLSLEDHSMPLLQINRFAEELERLSDAMFLEDSFTTLGIPSISGSVEGFGSHTIESSSTADPSVDKLCKGKNKKPPSLETLYSTGANESGFFFGNSDSYVTRPTRQRDRHLLSYSGLHSRGLGFLDNNCLSEEISDNSESGLDVEETDSSVQLRTRVRSEDDILLNPQVSSAFLLLPSLLEQGLDTARKYGFTRDQTPLLQLRKNQVATHALGIMHTLVANCDLWYVGLRHDDDNEAVQKNHVWLGDSVLDHPLSLDYLPFLREIAHHENRARRQVEDMMKENGDVTRGGRRTRTSRKNLRRHYLDEASGGQDKKIEVKSLELAKNYMG